MTGLLTLYQSATKAGKPLLDLLLQNRVKRGKEDPARLGERKGMASLPRPNDSVIWLHAASVGEAQSALILLDAIEINHPSVSVVVTTGTVTSATLMQRRLPRNAVHQYAPLDHPAWVENFLNHWRPDLALWMESELWPNMLTALRARKIPAALVNARLSDNSYRNWKFARGFAKSLLDCFTLILAQTQKDAAHYESLGANNVIVSDNIKYSAAPLPYDELALSTLKLAVGERPVWVYASTHAGEESLACRVHKTLKETLPDLLTIIVPRHPERRDDIANICFENSVKFRLRGKTLALPTSDDDIYIADTLGELGLFYTLSPIAMIGRSFSDDGGGGHNPVEAAQLGCAVLTGPNNQFQMQLYDDMRMDFAVREVRTENELIAALLELMTDPELLKDMQRNTSAFVKRKTHVVDRVLELLSPMLKTLEGRNAA